MKGASFERETARELSTWWSDGENDNLFWRTSQSGGRATTRKKAGKANNAQHCGDLCAINPLGQPLISFITLELKRGYQSATIADLLDRPQKAAQQTYESFFQQVITSSIDANTPHWVLIHKRDKREKICFFPWDLFEKLVEVKAFPNYPRPLFCINSPMTWLSENDVKEAGPDIRLAGMRLADFLSGVKPKHILKLGEEHAKRSSGT